MVNSCVLLSDNDHLLRIGQAQILLYIKAFSDGMVIDFLMFTSRPSPMEWSLIFLCLHQGPLRWNGHWFSYVYIKAISDWMVIDFLMFTARPSPMEWSLFSFFTSRPSPMEWSLTSLCLHQGPLQWNGHWFLCYSKTLSNGMVIYFFLHIKALSNGMVIDFCHIKALSDGMVIDFLMFTSRPSPMEWSLISLSHQGPLQWNDHWFLSH